MRFYDVELKVRAMEAEDERGPFMGLDEPAVGMRITIDPRIFDHDSPEVCVIISRQILEAFRRHYKKEKS